MCLVQLNVTLCDWRWSGWSHTHMGSENNETQEIVHGALECVIANHEYMSCFCTRQWFPKLMYTCFMC